ncbi:hypothetical protein [Sporosalibacterium faouarense]|nr:hypothetical protein [Sporosalibacterium faouarense]
MIFKGLFGSKLDDKTKVNRKTSVRAIVSQNQKYLMILNKTI